MHIHTKNHGDFFFFKRTVLWEKADLLSVEFKIAFWDEFNLQKRLFYLPLSSSSLFCFSSLTPQ